MHLSSKLKIGATVVGMIPVIFFLLFAFGEGAGGVGHYLQVAPIVALVIFGWYKPKPAGYILGLLGAVFAVLYVITTWKEPLATVALVEAVVFAPVLCSGYLFLRSSEPGRKKK